MPIYEYRCNVCGHQEEHLQKVTEPPLTVCPACGKPEYRKQLSAAGFQLKGTGWYATDYAKGTGTNPAPKAGDGATKTDEKSDSKSDSKKSDSKTESTPAPATVNVTPPSTTKDTSTK